MGTVPSCARARPEQALYASNLCRMLYGPQVFFIFFSSNINKMMMIVSVCAYTES